MPMQLAILQVPFEACILTIIMLCPYYGQAASLQYI